LTLCKRDVEEYPALIYPNSALPIVACC